MAEEISRNVINIQEAAAESVVGAQEASSASESIHDVVQQLRVLIRQVTA